MSDAPTAGHPEELNLDKIQRRRVVLAEWVEGGQSPYNEEGSIIFLRNILKDLDALFAAVPRVTGHPEELLERARRWVEVAQQDPRQPLVEAPQQLLQDLMRPWNLVSDLVNLVTSTRARLEAVEAEKNQALLGKLGAEAWGGVRLEQLQYVQEKLTALLAELDKRQDEATANDERDAERIRGFNRAKEIGAERAREILMSFSVPPAAATRREEALQEALTTVADAHHKTLVPSKLHDPEHLDRDECPTIPCKTATAALATTPEPPLTQPARAQPHAFVPPTEGLDGPDAACRVCGFVKAAWWHVPEPPPAPEPDDAWILVRALEEWADDQDESAEDYAHEGRDAEAEELRRRAKAAREFAQRFAAAPPSSRREDDR